MKAVLYVHGKGGSPSESEHYKALFPEYDVFGLDYHTFGPEPTGKEVRAAIEELTPKYDEIILITNSIGAVFSMYGRINEMVNEAFFISPVVDLNQIFQRLLTKEGLTEQDLRERGSFTTHTGIDLHWKDLCYGRANPFTWDVPTHILYGEFDKLVPIDSIWEFAKTHNVTVTMMPGGAHWFHTEEQMAFLDEWIKKERRV